MATQVQLRRGNTSQTLAFTGAVAEITIDTDKETVVVHDGSTAGGFALARESALTANASSISAAFNTANAAFIQANTPSNVANSAASYANSAFLQANTPSHVANSASSYANSAYTQANTATTNAATADAKAVTAGSYANSAYSQANTATTNASTADAKAVTAGSYANSAYTQANTATTNAATADSKAVSAGSYANSAFTVANTKFASAGGTISGDVVVTGNLTIQGQQTYANTQTVLIADNIITVNAAINQASAPAFNAGIEVDRGSSANTALLWNESTDKWTATNDGTNYFNLASDAAESYANSAYTQSNTATTNAATADAKAVTAGSYANSAFTVANGTASVANTDYTTISATAGVYGNAAFHPVVTLTANGRVSSITNTAIAIDASAITSGTLSNTRGGTGTTSSTGTGSVVLGTAPTLTLPTINNIRQGYSTTVTAAGTTTLTVNSNYLQFFTGTTTQILSLPAPQTMTLGMGFFVVNNSTGNIEVRASNAAAVATILAGTAMLFVSIDLTMGNGAAGWSAEIVGFSTVTGTGAAVLNTSPTLSNVSVSSVNVTNTTTSTSNSTGAITVAGGVGVKGNVYVDDIKVTNRVDWTGTGYAQPSFTTRSAGQKLTLYPAISGSAVDYSIGIDGGVLWSTVPVSSNEYSFKWYGGQTQIASLSGVGVLDVISANIIGSNTSTSNTTGALKVTGGVGVTGNVALDGVIFADGTRQTTAAVGGGASIGDVLALSIALG
jgi:hypothetical protein